MAKSKEATPRQAIAAEESATTKMKKKPYEEELARLQLELIKLQEWIKHTGVKVVEHCEGRDDAGYVHLPMSDQTFVPDRYA